MKSFSAEFDVPTLIAPVLPRGFIQALKFRVGDNEIFDSQQTSILLM